MRSLFPTVLVALALAASGCGESPPPPASSPAELAHWIEQCDTQATKTALAALTAAVDAYPRVPDTWRARGLCHWMRYNRTQDAAHAREAIADYSDAIARADRGHTVAAFHADLLSGRALLQAALLSSEKEGDWDPVLADFDRAIELEPTAQRHIDRAMAHIERSDGDRAEADLAAAHQLAPADAEIAEQIDGVRQSEEAIALLGAP